MAALERLFALEVEFHHRLRCNVPGIADAAAVRTSYALQSDYERLLRIVGHVTAQEIELMAARFTLAGDARDVLAARDSLVRMLRL